MNEAQATLAEEVVGDRVKGRARGRNYGYDVAFEDDWYRGITLLAVYFGMVLEENPKRPPNAPEQCSFLGLSAEGNDGPCFSNDFVAYNTGYALLRWLSDQFSTSVPGGEKAIQRALVENRSSGLAALASVAHVPIDTLLAQWAAALYVDDRVPGAAQRLTFSSWNLFDMDTRRKNPTGHLLPRERPFGAFSDAVSVRGGSTAYFRRKRCRPRGHGHSRHRARRRRAPGRDANVGRAVAVNRRRRPVRMTQTEGHATISIRGVGGPRRNRARPDRNPLATPSPAPEP
jgi:hypothetical protein